MIVEGYGLRGEILARLQERLEKVAYVWSANRLDLSSTDTAHEAELEMSRSQVAELQHSGGELRRRADATKLELEALSEDRERSIAERTLESTNSKGQLEVLSKDRETLFAERGIANGNSRNCDSVDRSRRPAGRTIGQADNGRLDKS